MGFLVMASLPPWGIGRENCKKTGKPLQTTSPAFSGVRNQVIDSVKRFRWTDTK
jgi:hypothetical protein